MSFSAPTQLHSWLSPKCNVMQSRIDRLEVFAPGAIAPGEMIALWGGKVYPLTEEELIRRECPQMSQFPRSVRTQHMKLRQS